MKRLLFVLTATFIFFSSCNKDKEETPAQEKLPESSEQQGLNGKYFYSERVDYGNNNLVNEEIRFEFDNTNKCYYYNFYWDIDDAETKIEDGYYEWKLQGDDVLLMRPWVTYEGDEGEFTLYMFEYIDENNFKFDNKLLSKD